MAKSCIARTRVAATRDVVLGFGLLLIPTFIKGFGQMPVTKEGREGWAQK